MHIYFDIYTCYVYIYIFTCVYTHLNCIIQSFIYLCVYMCTHVYMRVYIYIYLFICEYTCIYTYRCIYTYTCTLRKDVASTQQVLLPRHLHLNKQIIIGTIMTSGPGGLTSADVCLMKKLQRSIPHHVLVLLDIQPDKARLYI